MFELSEGVWALEVVATDGEGGWYVIAYLSGEDDGDLTPIGWRPAELQEIPNTRVAGDCHLSIIGGSTL